MRNDFRLRVYAKPIQDWLNKQKETDITPALILSINRLLLSEQPSSEACSTALYTLLKEHGLFNGIEIDQAIDDIEQLLRDCEPYLLLPRLYSMQLMIFLSFSEKALTREDLNDFNALLNEEDTGEVIDRVLQYGYATVHPKISDVTSGQQTALSRQRYNALQEHLRTESQRPAFDEIKTYFNAAPGSQTIRNMLFLTDLPALEQQQMQQQMSSLAMQMLTHNKGVLMLVDIEQGEANTPKTTVKKIEGELETEFGIAEQELLDNSIDILLPEKLRASHNDLLLQALRRHAQQQQPIVRQLLNLEGRRRVGKSWTPTQIELSIMPVPSVHQQHAYRVLVFMRSLSAIQEELTHDQHQETKALLQFFSEVIELNAKQLNQNISRISQLNDESQSDTDSGNISPTSIHRRSMQILSTRSNDSAALSASADSFTRILEFVKEFNRYRQTYAGTSYTMFQFKEVLHSFYINPYALIQYATRAYKTRLQSKQVRLAFKQINDEPIDIYIEDELMTRILEATLEHILTYCECHSTLKVELNSAAGSDDAKKVIMSFGYKTDTNLNDGKEHLQNPPSSRIDKMIIPIKTLGISLMHACLVAKRLGGKVDYHCSEGIAQLCIDIPYSGFRKGESDGVDKVSFSPSSNQPNGVSPVASPSVPLGSAFTVFRQPTIQEETDSRIEGSEVSASAEQQSAPPFRPQGHDITLADSDDMPGATQQHDAPPARLEVDDKTDKATEPLNVVPTPERAIPTLPEARTTCRCSIL